MNRIASRHGHMRGSGYGVKKAVRGDRDQPLCLVPCVLCVFVSQSKPSELVCKT